MKGEDEYNAEATAGNERSALHGDHPSSRGRGRAEPESKGRPCVVFEDAFHSSGSERGEKEFGVREREHL